MFSRLSLLVMETIRYKIAKDAAILVFLLLDYMHEDTIEITLQFCFGDPRRKEIHALFENSSLSQEFTTRFPICATDQCKGFMIPHRHAFYPNTRLCRCGFVDHPDMQDWVRTLLESVEDKLVRCDCCGHMRYRRPIKIVVQF